MKKLKLFIEDTYLRWPIIWDFLIGITVFFLLLKYEPILNSYTRENQENNLLYLISTNVSLAGFVIAALTIIITFKENMQAKSIDEAKTGIEFLFNSPIYKSIISVFVYAIVEFVLVYMSLFLVNIFSKAISDYKFSAILLSLLMVSFFTALRVISVLFKTIKLQLKER